MSDSIKRNRYYDPEGTEEFKASERNTWEDFNYFHLPLAALHQAGLHRWGILRGLEITPDGDGSAAHVQAGIAVDAAGRLIALLEGACGDVGSDPRHGEHDPQPVPVLLSLEGHAGQKLYVTAEFSEYVRPRSPYEPPGGGGWVEQAPWLRLRPASELDASTQPEEAPGTFVVLAILEVDGEGRLLTLKDRDPRCKYRRQGVGERIEELEFWRASAEKGSVGQVLSGRVQAGEAGGLEITVKSPEDSLNVRAAVSVGTADAPSPLSVAGPTDLQDTLHVAGSLGIGTASSRADLEVSGATKLQGSLSVTGQADLAGNVGIGTADPQAPQGRLHVAGNAAVLNLEGANHAYVQWYPRGLAAGRKAWMGYASKDNEFFTIANDTGSMRILGTERLFLLNKDGVIVGKGQDGSGALTVEGKLSVLEGLEVTGNVSIWTTSPDSKLDVKGTLQTTDLEIVHDNWAYLDIRSSEPKTDAVIRLCDRYGRNDERFWSVHNDDSAGNNLDIRFNNYSRMAVTPDGNVSIVTVGPEIPLQVRKDSASSTYDIIKFGDSCGFAYIGAGSTSFGLADKDKRMRLTILQSSGNVGIETAEPQAKLQIINKAQDAGGNTLILGPTNAANLRLGYDTNYSWVQSHGGKPLAINPIGNNVGIGTTDPRQRLVVQGAPPRIALVEKDGDAGVLEFHEGTNQVRLQHWTEYGKTWKKNMMVLDADSGNVGIGTVQPEAKLHVGASGHDPMVNPIVIQNCKADHEKARDLLTRLGSSTVVVGGVKGNRLLFYWRSEDGASFFYRDFSGDSL